jgi:NADPH-dependent curcumin reductase CurA
MEDVKTVASGGLILNTLNPKAREMAGWMVAGRLKSRPEYIVEGLETFPDALLKLFKGENIGKLILKVADA